MYINFIRICSLNLTYQITLPRSSNKCNAGFSSTTKYYPALYPANTRMHPSYCAPLIRSFMNLHPKKTALFPKQKYQASPQMHVWRKQFSMKNGRPYSGVHGLQYHTNALFQLGTPAPIPGGGSQSSLNFLWTWQKYPYHCSHIHKCLYIRSSCFCAQVFSILTCLLYVLSMYNKINNNSSSFTIGHFTFFNLLSNLKILYFWEQAYLIISLVEKLECL